MRDPFANAPVACFRGVVVSGPAHGGFTLVELLVAVVILSVLAAVVVPQFSTTTADSEAAALKTTLHEVRTAITRYQAEHGHWPGSVPAVPAADCSTGRAGMGRANNPGQVTVAMVEQLALYTDVAGGACSVASPRFRYGPYLRLQDLEMPANPVTGNNSIHINTTGDLSLTSTAAPGEGWLYDPVSGKFLADDANWAQL